MGKIFGIDLGTTYSCIAYVDEYEKAVTIVNAAENNSPVTPSVVYFPKAGGKPVVGGIAKEQMQNHPELVCSTIKRQMGKRDFHFSANEIEYTPEEISAYILKTLADYASLKMNEEVKDVVITCPAYFGMDEREATKKAGEIAGLNVISIINEPTAAAISYGMKSNDKQTVMVYDLGGGTFDVTIIQVSDGIIEVVATEGDHKLGGKDWDEKIRERAMQQYLELTGGSKNDIETDIEMLGELEIKSEIAKKQLSTLPETTFRIGRASTKVTISLEQFESDTASLLNSTIDLTDLTIKEAKQKGVTQIDKILLVGGSTFMPQVKKCLAEKFPETPIEFCDPNESVAKGAALYGWNIEAYKLGEEVHKTEDGHKLPPVIKNVISKSYALEFADGNGGTYIENVIFKNSSVPLEHPHPCSTPDDNLTGLMVSLFEDDQAQCTDPKLKDGNIVPRDHAKLLVSDQLKPLPPHLPKGSPISVLLKINEEGLLTADVKDETGGSTLHMEVKLLNAMKKAEEDEAIRRIDTLYNISR